jgi:glycosyltransferase involved in cell wall biosynthesis
VKVLYVISGQSFFSEDPGRKISALVRCWRRIGHQVEFLCGGDVLSGSRRRDVWTGQVNPAYLPWYRRQPLLSPLVNSVSELLNVRHDRHLSSVVASKIEAFRPDLYWQRSSRLDGFTFAAARRSGVPTVLEWKDNVLSLYGFALLKPYAARVERGKESSADFLVVESGVLKTQLARITGREGDSILVAHNAIDPAEFPVDETHDRTEARRKLGLPVGDFLAVYVGTFGWYHRVELLVEAIAASRGRADAPIRAALVGDGQGRAAAAGRARELGVEDLIRFVGNVPYDEVPDWLVAADTAVLPDCTDIITPIKVFEYMAMRLPALVPDYRVNREVIEDEVTGLLFEPRNPEAMSRKLLRLRGDSALRDSIGAAARRKVLDRFTWERTWGRALEEIGVRARLPLASREG